MTGSSICAFHSKQNRSRLLFWLKNLRFFKDIVKDFLPESLVLSLLVARRMREWEKKNLIFVHVPKNGGTSLNQALYGRFMGHCRVRDIERVRSKLLDNVPSFSVTRNPWARAYSAWSFVRRGAGMNDGAQIRNPSQFSTQEFATFERFVLEWLPAVDISKQDFVFRSQSHFLLNKDGEIGVGHLGRIEDSSTYLQFVEDILHYKVEIRHLNRTSSVFDYREAYSAEMCQTVGRIYADDLTRFNYDF